MKTRIAIIAAAALAMTGALLSCTANGGSIYATIEGEQKIPVSTLIQTITVQDIVNTGVGSLRYFVAAGAIYNGSVPDSSNTVGWPTVGQAPVPLNTPLDGSLKPAISQAMVVSTIAGETDRLYASFFSSDGSVMGLYRSSNTNPYSFRPSDAGVTQISGPSVGDATLMGKQIVLLAATASPTPYLFAVAATPTATAFTYELDYSINGTAWTAVPGMTGLSSAITGVAWLQVNNTFYATSGSALYSGAVTPAALAATTFTGEAGNELLRGVTADNTANHLLLIPGKQGTVYVSSDGTAWTPFATADQVNGALVGFLTVSQVVGSSGPVYLVGSDGNGFYYLNVGASNGTIGTGLSRYSDVTVTGLYAGAVRRILVDGPLVFMGAASTGLWRSSFNNSTGALAGTWIHE